MSGRKCHHCKRPGGSGPRELRPYGPVGADVCAECVFNGPPERLKQAETVFRGKLREHLRGAEPLLLDAREQVGPRPLHRGRRRRS